MPLYNPASASLPVVDTTAIVKGSADPTKTLFIEVDGFTAPRTMTPPNQNFLAAGQDVANVFTAAQTIQGPTATTIPLTIKTTDDDQTNPLQRWLNSSSVAVASVSPKGFLSILPDILTDESGTVIMINAVGTEAPGADSTVEFIGIHFEPRFSGSSNFTNNIWAVSGAPSIKTTGTVSNVIAFLARNTKENAGEVTNNVGFSTRFDNFGGTNLETYHFLARDYLNVFGVATTQYGL